MLLKTSEESAPLLSASFFLGGSKPAQHLEKEHAHTSRNSGTAPGVRELAEVVSLNYFSGPSFSAPGEKIKMAFSEGLSSTGLRQGHKETLVISRGMVGQVERVEVIPFHLARRISITYLSISFI